MDQLGVDRASLIGNSLGGRIAWNFAAAHPDRVTCLVLVAPDGFASPGFDYDKATKTPLMMQALPYVAPRGMLKANLAAAYAHPEALSEATVTRYRDMMLAPCVRPAILARMGPDHTARPRPDPGWHPNANAAALGRERRDDPDQQRGGLPSANAARHAGAPSRSRPSAVRGRSGPLPPAGGTLSLRRSLLKRIAGNSASVFEGAQPVD
jgi:pimeloyl-ACP methyl ester carboxylesterase